jgi:hypothetical protein
LRFQQIDKFPEEDKKLYFACQAAAGAKIQFLHSAYVYQGRMAFRVKKSRDLNHWQRDSNDVSAG